ncbi:MAG: hypothetical protein NZ518_07735, partial [Dehalococcoidia bacterium]|nr:hypothetical protein [Dehalococcoidia bacterium]
MTRNERARQRTLIVGAVVAVAVGMAALGAVAVAPRPTAVVPPPATVERLPSPARPTVAPIPIPPDRDLYDLAQRLRGTGPIAPLRYVGDPDLAVGARASFWVQNLPAGIGAARQVEAVARHVGPDAVIWVQEGVAVTEREVLQSASDFADRVKPCVNRIFGEEWAPGQREPGARIAIFAGDVRGVAGYYSSADEYPTAVNPLSNQRKMFYINAGAIRLGTQAFVGTMAHEFQHMVHWNHDRAEQVWVNEGLSELAADLCGTGAAFLSAFAREPNTQLTAWPESSAAAAPHYGAAYLFMKYLAHRFGLDTIRDLVA